MANKLIALLLGGLWISPLAGAYGQPPGAPLVEITGERLDFSPGDPLSVRALVTRPLAVPGVLSWSLETRRHRGTIWYQALSPDGRTLATGGLDGTVRLWDVESGRLVRALIGHHSYVNGLDWSPDGNTLASAGTYDGTVRLWDARTGRPLRVLKGHGREVFLVKWSADGKTVAAAGGESGAFSTWTVESSVKRGTLELGRPIFGLSWHPDGNSVAIACHTMALQLWDSEKNLVTRKVGNPVDGFVAVAWRPDGKILAGGTGKSAILYDGTSGEVVRTLVGPATTLAWNRSGTHIATLLPSSIKVWEAAMGSLQKTIPVALARSFVTTADFAVFVSGFSTAFEVHDGSSGKSLRRFDNLAGTKTPWWWFGKALVTGMGSPQLTQWDPETGKSVRALKGHTGNISAVAVSPSGKMIATASLDKTVKLWESATGQLAQTFTGHSSPALAVAFAFDGKTIASSEADKKILVWDASSGKILSTLTGATTDLTALAWKPGSTTFLASNGMLTSARVWNVRTAKVDKTHEGSHEIVSLAWSPDGTRIANGQGNALVEIWQVASTKLLLSLPESGSPPQVTSLAWSPNGQILAAGRGNHTMQLWDARNGKKLHSLQMMAPVERVSWGPASSTVTASNQDRSVRFVNPQNGKNRGVLVAEDEQILAINFDGNYRAPNPEPELVYVVLTNRSQDTYLPSQFEDKFKWKNNPGKMTFLAK